MNILLIVISLLMIMAGITYNRIESFKSSMITRAEYENFITKKAREEYNKEQDKLFSYANCSPQQVSLSWLLQRGKNNTPKTVEDKDRTVFKELLNNLYGKTPFYLELQKKSPNFQDTLIEHLIRGVDQLMSESKEANNAFRLEEDIAKIPIADPALQQAFQTMLRGTRNRITPTYDGDKNYRTELGAEEFYPLMDLIRYEKRKTILNAAPTEILDIYFPKEISDQILEVRRTLDGDERKQAFEGFKQHLKDPDYIKYIDFITNCDKDVENDNNNPSNENPQGSAKP